MELLALYVSCKLIFKKGVVTLR